MKAGGNNSLEYIFYAFLLLISFLFPVVGIILFLGAIILSIIDQHEITILTIMYAVMSLLGYYCLY